MKNQELFAEQSVTKQHGADRVMFDRHQEEATEKLLTCYKTRLEM